MADKTGAKILGRLFAYLANRPVLSYEVRNLARFCWKEAAAADFTSDQLKCDPDLVRLGLARKETITEAGETIEVIVYADAEGRLPEKTT